MKLKNLDNIVALFDKGNDENAAFGIEKNGNYLLPPTSRSHQNSPVRKQIGHCISPIKTVSVSNLREILNQHDFCDVFRCRAAKKFRLKST